MLWMTLARTPGRQRSQHVVLKHRHRANLEHRPSHGMTGSVLS
jgi:hypothetical protein